jgi:hypothetical protein
MAGQNWHRINLAPAGAGALLLRAGSGSLDGVFVGYQADDGRWFSGEELVHPTHYCEIPAFDCDDAEGESA